LLSLSDVKYKQYKDTNVDDVTCERNTQICGVTDAKKKYNIAFEF